MSLIQFCKEGDLEGVKAALQRGANVNTKDEYGWTGLMRAVTRSNVPPNHNSVVALLLSTPTIDVNLKSEMGISALHFAVQWKTNTEALKLLLGGPNIDVNIVNICGEGALHWAVKRYNNVLYFEL